MILSQKTPLHWVSHRSLSFGSKLYYDYLRAAPALRPFYRHPYQPGLDWQPVFDEVKVCCESHRHKMADIVRQANSYIGNTHPAVEKNIGLLAQPNTFCVITGQQTGVFLGPLYTIHKALTAVALSRQLQERYPHYRVIPVFWCSADDHDFPEISRTAFISQDNQLIEQQYLTDDFELKPIYKLPAPENLPDLISELLTQTGNRPYLADIGDLLNSTLQDSTSVSRWVSRVMAQLFGRFGVILIPSNLPPLRQMMQPLFAREIDSPAFSTSLVNAAGQQLIDAGYHGQIDRHERAVNIFYHQNQRRYRLIWQDDYFELDQLNQKWAYPDLQKVIAEHPERFSPGVVLRPIIQDYLFPTVAYVAGPGEIAYFAQLKPVYEACDIPMPVVFPRSSLTIVEPKVQRLLDKLNIEFTDVFHKPDWLVQRVMNDSFSDAFETKVEHTRLSIRAELDELLIEIQQLHSDTVQFAEQSFGKIDYTIRQVRDKVFQAHKKQQKVVRSQLDTILTHIVPNGKPQERVLNIFPYLMTYGPDVLDDLLAFIEMDISSAYFELSATSSQ